MKINGIKITKAEDGGDTSQTSSEAKPKTKELQQLRQLLAVGDQVMA
jgi:hypothetical protein